MGPVKPDETSARFFIHVACKHRRFFARPCSWAPAAARTRRPAPRNILLNIENILPRYSSSSPRTKPIAATAMAVRPDAGFWAVAGEGMNDVNGPVIRDTEITGPRRPTPPLIHRVFEVSLAAGAHILGTRPPKLPGFAKPRQPAFQIARHAVHYARLNPTGSREREVLYSRSIVPESMVFRKFRAATSKPASPGRQAREPV
jgi:hypothetical protein